MAASFPEDRYRAPPPVSADDLEQLYEDAAAVAQVYVAVGRITALVDKKGDTP